MLKVSIYKPYRIWIYSIFALIWCSGLTFFVLKTWFYIKGEFGIQKHPLQFTALQIHGFAAFVMMVTYGYFLGIHIQSAWQVKPLRIFGVLLMIMPVFLMITAYLLYYIAEDTARDIIGYAHFAVGFTLPFILVTHIIMNRIQKNRIRNLRRNKHEN